MRLTAILPCRKLGVLFALEPRVARTDRFGSDSPRDVSVKLRYRARVRHGRRRKSTGVSPGGPGVPRIVLAETVADGPVVQTQAPQAGVRGAGQSASGALASGRNAKAIQQALASGLGRERAVEVLASTFASTFAFTADSEATDAAYELERAARRAEYSAMLNVRRAMQLAQEIERTRQANDDLLGQRAAVQRAADMLRLEHREAAMALRERQAELVAARAASIEALQAAIDARLVAERIWRHHESTPAGSGRRGGAARRAWTERVADLIAGCLVDADYATNSNAATTTPRPRPSR